MTVQASTEPTFTRKRAGRMQRLFFKAPAYLYFRPFSNLLAWRCILRLTTTGRKSGLPRKTCVSFMPSGSGYIVFAGWGASADWYRNLRANPSVRVRIGNRETDAIAYPVEDPDRRQSLMDAMSVHSRTCGPPGLMRSLLAHMRLFDYEAEIRDATAHARDLPVMEIQPVELAAT